MAIVLRAPQSRDESAFLAAVAASCAFHRPWVDPPDSAARFAEYLARVARPENAARLIVDSATAELVGVVNFSQIVRGAFENAYLGFYAFAPFAGRGLMRRGLLLALREAFGPLGLHRVEANIQPTNEASRRLVQRCGFRLEGYSPRYLRIAGEWRDHERWALLADEFEWERYAAVPSAPPTVL